jgi:hypothetical protein
MLGSPVVTIKLLFASVEILNGITSPAASDTPSTFTLTEWF